MRFDEAIKSYGFNQNIDEPCVYKYIKQKKVVFLVLCVDDILPTGNDVGLLTNVKKWLDNQIKMKDLGEASYVLGFNLFKIARTGCWHCLKHRTKVLNLKEIVHQGNVAALKITSKNKHDDPFTKSLLAKSFEGHLEGLGLRDMSHLL